MPQLKPSLPHYIEGLSDRTCREVCELLLSFPSVLGARGPAHARATQVLFPDEPFVHPGGVMGWLWSWAWRVMDQIGLWLESGGIDDGHWGLSDGDWQFLQQYRPAIKAAAMETLFLGARRVLVLMAGPEPFQPTGQRLRELNPFSLPSVSYSRYVRDVTGKDIEPGLSMIEKFISQFMPLAPEAFPRIGKFRG